MKFKILTLVMSIAFTGNVFAAKCVIEGETLSVISKGVKYECETGGFLVSQTKCTSEDSKLVLGFIPRSDDQDKLHLMNGTVYGEASYEKLRLSASIGSDLECNTK